MNSEKLYANVTAPNCPVMTKSHPFQGKPKSQPKQIYPGAFNMTTGAAHWELLSRARAVDNQVILCSCS